MPKANKHYCDIEELFREMQVRSTKQKHAIFEALLTPKRAWSAKQLWHKLGTRAGNLSTIHRNLTAFAKAGIIHVALEDASQTIYEKIDDRHHDHLKCLACGMYQCVPCGKPEQRGNGKTKAMTHILLFEGLCTHCA